MAITKEDVLKALSYVEEPDLGQDLVTLNMIEDVQIDGRTVSFTVVLHHARLPAQGADSQRLRARHPHDGG